jgi:hypothetical protein
MCARVSFRNGRLRHPSAPLIVHVVLVFELWSNFVKSWRESPSWSRQEWHLSPELDLCQNVTAKVFGWPSTETGGPNARAIAQSFFVEAMKILVPPPLVHDVILDCSWFKSTITVISFSPRHPFHNSWFVRVVPIIVFRVSLSNFYVTTNTTLLTH